MEQVIHSGASQFTNGVFRDLCSMYGSAIPEIISLGGTLAADFTQLHFYGITGAAGANSALWLGESWFPNGPDDAWQVDDPVLGQTGFFARPSIMDVIHWNENVTGATAHTKTGISLGCATVATMVVNPVYALVALYARWDVPQWELLVAPGTEQNAGGTGIVTVLTGVKAPTVGDHTPLRIVYIPGQYIEAYVNGVLGARVLYSKNKAAFPFNGPSATPAIAAGAGCFFGQTGSSASAIIDGWWAYPRITTY